MAADQRDIKGDHLPIDAIIAGVAVLRSRRSKNVARFAILEPVQSDRLDRKVGMKDIHI